MKTNNPTSESLARIKEQLQEISEAIADIQTKYTIEKNAKNEAYAFILVSGLLNEFKEFTEATAGTDYHDVCLWALNNIPQTEK